METHVRTAYSTYTAQKTPRHHFSNHNKLPGRQKGRRFNKNFPKNMKTVVSLYKDEICVSVCIPHAACVHAFYIIHNIPTRHKMRESDVRGSLSAPTAFIPDGCALRNKIFPASIRKREYFIEERKRSLPSCTHTHTHSNVKRSFWLLLMIRKVGPSSSPSGNLSLRIRVPVAAWLADPGIKIPD
jgi:hypothetical protein